MNNQKRITPSQIIDFIGWQLNVPISNIFPHTDLSSDLNLDDIDQLLLIAELENRLEVYLSKEEVEKINTIKDASIVFLKNVA